MKTGTQDYLMKPFDIDELLDHDWAILYWHNLVELSLSKSYHTYLRRAGRLGIKEEDYLAHLYDYI